jgi:dihydrolipoamide dehydrogenase
LRERKSGKREKRSLWSGAGAVGLELGSLWNRLGSEVTMLEFLLRIALGFDLELSNLLQCLLTAQGMTFHLETKVTAVKFDNGRATVTATKGGQEQKFKADKVPPILKRPGRGKVGVEFDEKRRIKVDKDFRTNIEGIYAIGDVIAGPMLAHKAENEKNCLRRNHREQAGHVNQRGACCGPTATNTRR